MLLALCPKKLIPLLSVLVAVVLASPPLLADAVEQKVRLQVIPAEAGGQCKVSAVFKGDHDNCKNDKAKGRADCAKESGCICTRQEKHVTWESDNKEIFTIAFDQGSANPFVVKGDNECSLQSNKKGKLRCRVKGKEVPAAIYRYSISVPNCAPAHAQIKIY